MSKFKTEWLSPRQILDDPSVQFRKSDHWRDTAKEYAEAMREKTKFPAAIVYYDGETYWLSDGFTRHLAAQFAKKKLLCEIREGGRAEAKLNAISGENQTNGQRYSLADKKDMALKMMSDPEINTDPATQATWSDSEIARRCHLHRVTVGEIRKSYLSFSTGMESDNRTFIHPKTGRPTTMDISKSSGSKKPTEADNEPEWIALADVRPPEDELVETGGVDRNGSIGSGGTGFINKYKEASFEGERWLCSHWRRITDSPQVEDSSVSDSPPLADEDPFADEEDDGEPDFSLPPAEPGTSEEFDHPFADVDAETEEEADPDSGDVSPDEPEPTIEEQIRTSPLGQALSLHGHQGYKFVESALMQEDFWKKINAIKGIAGRLRHATNATALVLAPVARFAHWSDWEGCPACKGTGRFGERKDPCDTCRTWGFVIIPGTGVSADVVRENAEPESV